MRFPLKKLLLTVSAICLLGLLSIGGILKPALNSKGRKQSEGTDLIVIYITDKPNY